MKYTIFNVISVLIICNSCSPTKIEWEPTISGSFIQQDVRSRSLIFSGNQFTYHEDGGTGVVTYCCETITMGNFSIDKKKRLLYLSTPDSLDGNIEIDVSESKKNSSDSLYFQIFCPAQTDYYGNIIPESNFSYQLFLEGKSESLLTEFMYVKHKTNNIKIAFGKSQRLTGFGIDIIPDLSQFSFRNYPFKFVTTTRYKLQNSESNNFRIDIPQLTIGYLAYTRLHEDVVEIVDKNTLKWNGSFFKRQRQR